MRTAEQEATGLAHVATVSFLASRATPTGGFWLALAGGTALARAAARLGGRTGFGASVAAMLETVAIMGPARFGVPLTQAITAPILGRMEAKGRGPLAQWAVCAAIRVLHNSLTVALLVFVILGGVDAYADSYDSIFAKLPLLPEGEDAALIATGVTLVGWAVFATAVQVAVYRRALRDWPDGGQPQADEEQEDEAAAARRFDPRALALAAVVAVALLLASIDWVVIGAVGAWLAVAWVAAQPDRETLPTGLVITAVLALGVLGVSLLGGMGIDEAARRALRAALLVLVATWLRGAAGAAGLRELFARMLARVRRVPAMREAAETLDTLGSDRGLVEAGRHFADSLRDVEKSPVPIVDAVLEWTAREAGRFSPGARVVHPALSARPLDGVLVAAALLPALALLAA